MAEKLDAGDQFPDMNLNLVGGGSLTLPGGGASSRYVIALFYRGHW